MDQRVEEQDRATAAGRALPGEDRAPLSQSELRAIMASLMLAMFLAALDQTIVATALPTIGHQFHDVSNLSWVITAYLVSSTAMAPVFGTLSDIYGRRVTITLSLLLFIVGSVLCALAPNLIVLILARALQGVGGGGILPVVQTIIESGVAVDATAWSGMFAPARTPAAIVNKLGAKLRSILKLPDVQERLASDGTNFGANTPQSLLAFIKNESEKYRTAVKDSGRRLA